MQLWICPRVSRLPAVTSRQQRWTLQFTSHRLRWVPGENSFHLIPPLGLLKCTTSLTKGNSSTLIVSVVLISRLFVWHRWGGAAAQRQELDITVQGLAIELQAASLPPSCSLLLVPQDWEVHVARNAAAGSTAGGDNSDNRGLGCFEARYICVSISCSKCNAQCCWARQH